MINCFHVLQVVEILAPRLEVQHIAPNQSSVVSNVYVLKLFTCKVSLSFSKSKIFFAFTIKHSEVLGSTFLCWISNFSFKISYDPIVGKQGSNYHHKRNKGEDCGHKRRSTSFKNSGHVFIESNEVASVEFWQNYFAFWRKTDVVAICSLSVLIRRCLARVE